MSVKTLVIPRVFENITKAQIWRVLEELNIGAIDRIDLKKGKGDKFNRVFIHYKEWYKNENSTMALERLTSGKDIKVIYDSPWFWKISTFNPLLSTFNKSGAKSTFEKGSVIYIFFARS